MGLFLGVLFCVVLSIAAIVAIILGIAAACRFGDGLLDYIEDCTDDYFEKKRDNKVYIVLSKQWSSHKVQVSYLGNIVSFETVEEFVEWLNNKN